YRGAGKRTSRYQSHQGDKYATPDSTLGRIDDGPLRADHRRLFMLYWAARASDVLIDLLLFNGYEHSLNSVGGGRRRWTGAWRVACFLTLSVESNLECNRSAGGDKNGASPA